MKKESDDFIIGGKWKILNKHYNGDLTFNRNKGIIILSVYYKDRNDFFAWMNKPTSISIITGKLNQEIKCTLTDCEVKKRHTDNFTRHHIVIIAKNLFINIYKNDKSSIKFNEVHFQIPNIIKWSKLNGFNYINNPEYKLNIAYKFKDNIKQKIDKNTTIEFVPILGKYNSDMQIENLDISQHVEVQIKKKKETEYQSFFQDFEKIINLITLATGLKINISLIQGINYKKYAVMVRKEKNYIKYEIIRSTYKNITNSNPDLQANINDYLFDLNEIYKDNKLQKWFDSYKVYENIYNLYNLAINNDLPDEIKFCNLMQAMELIHTHKFKKVDEFCKHIKVKFKDNNDLIKLVNENPDQKDFIILKNRIIDVFINDYDLTDRVKMINFIDDFSTILSDTRNYYTHYNDSKKDKCLVGKNLKYGIFVVEYIVSNNILLNLGFSTKEINKKKELQLNDIINMNMIESILKNDRL